MASLAAGNAGQFVEVWPENWPAFALLVKMQTQWRSSFSGPSGLDYLVLLALMARLNLSDADHDELFDDVQVLERAALETMNKKD